MLRIGIVGSQSDARYNCGQQFSFCRFTRMSFLPLLFQRRCLARFRSESLGEVSHSAGHSVVNWQNKKPIHRVIKNRREHCSRFKMMKLCIGFEIQIRGVCHLTNHAGRHCDIGWCGNVRLPLSSNRSFIYI